MSEAVVAAHKTTRVPTMKRIISIALLLTVAACSAADLDESDSSQESESLGESSELLLNGTPNGQGFLKLRNVANKTTETDRRNDTNNYYGSIFIDPEGDGGWNPDGSAVQTIATGLNTLQKFKDKYFTGWAGGETRATYYNRGDLGLGRDMHCVDRTSNWQDGQIACYVTNYVAAPKSANGKFSELSFGLSPNVAFDNFAANQPVATVAMVFRSLATTGRDKTFFVVYDAAGNKTDNAPLDRHGLAFFNEFDAVTNPTPNAQLFGTPGTTFNNHIPSNCLNCHGGTYQNTNAGLPRVSDAFFLPFDLDQFEYKDATGLRRAEQQTKFRQLNQIARKVAVGTANVNHSIVQQIDLWHGNTNHSATLVNNFDAAGLGNNKVPPGWESNASPQKERDIAVYKTVVRRSCRGCHMALKNNVKPNLRFETANEFLFYADSSAAFIKLHLMPHALQTQREFWQSGQRDPLETYFRDSGKSEAANTLHSAGPDTIVTLDPHIMSAY
jgi:hypothetical protein